MLNELKIYKSSAEWKDIQHGMNQFSWDNFTLERRGDMTVWLSKKYPSRFSEWNRKVKELKALAIEHVKNMTEEQAIDNDLATYLRWDFMHLLIEKSYSDLKNLPSFYNIHILPLYKENKVPYGWRGQFPTGELVYG